MRISDWVESGGGASGVGVARWRAGAGVSQVVKQVANQVTKWSRPVGWMLLAIFYVALCVNYEAVCTWCGRLELAALTSARSWRIR
ncbi:hypothetical protein [Paraburkholderia sp. ZP32-5]|uniref:hypothetical protein n=1 Tax=Paraburkholderia sp. ZP32-5 TaxID=2883245 RepID=UPI001F21EEF6|nr:hypothetical protein [Paraburkholderia sp. ZP32-5]